MSAMKRFAEEVEQGVFDVTHLLCGCEIYRVTPGRYSEFLGDRETAHFMCMSHTEERDRGL